MDIFRALDTLIDRWCERRAIRPLQCLLRVYPTVFTSAEQRFALLDALKDIRQFHRKDLTAEDLVWVGKLCDGVEEALRGAAR